MNLKGMGNRARPFLLEMEDGSLEYCVGFIFNSDMTKVLLLEMKKLYPGKLNGAGGKILEGETPLRAMYRKLGEETGIGADCIFSLHEIVSLNFSWGPRLNVFYGKIYSRFDKYWKLRYPGVLGGIGPEGHRLKWVDVRKIFRAKDNSLAGNGDIPYFINLSKMIEKERCKIETK